MAVSGASLSGIYKRLIETDTYHPLDADTYADWSLEAGDTVTIERDGASYTSPVATSNISWKKSQQTTLSAGGNESRTSVAKVSQTKYNSSSSGLKNSQYLHYYVEDSYNQMRSGLELTSSHALLYSENLYKQMRSGLYLTASSASLYVESKYDQMKSGLDLTMSSATLYVDDTYKQMRSGLALTSSTAALYVDNKYTQMRAGLNLTSSSAALYVNDIYKQMRSGLALTSSSAALYVDNKYTQMTAGLKLTSSSAALYVDNKYTQMTSGLKLTSSSAALYVDNKYTQMTAGLKLTSSSAALYVDNKYTQMRSGLALTSSTAALYVDNKYTQMRAGLNLTSSSAALYVNDIYKQMKSGLSLTSSSAALYVDNRYTQMTAGLKLTSSSAALYVDNKYTQMTSGLKLTSSTAALYVDNKYSQLKSGLDMTSSSAALYVDNKYNQMKAGLAITSSSAALYVQNRTTRAYIMTRINANNEGEALINADKVLISGSTKISDKLTVTNGNLVVLNGGSVVSNGFTYSSINGEENVPLSGAFKNCLATTSGGQVTLEFTTFAGNTQTVTFSKATTPVLTGSWSSGKLTVTSSPSAQSNYERLLSEGSPSWASDYKSATVPINAVWGSSGQYSESTGKNAYVNTTPAYNAGYNATHTAVIGGENGDEDDPDEVSSQTLSAGGHIDLWPYYQGNDTKWKWGSKITITAASPDYTLYYEGTSSFPSSSSPSDVLAGWNPFYISGSVPNSQPNTYRYIKFWVGNTKKSFYFT